MTKRRLLTYFLIPILSVYLFICNLSIMSFADVPSTQKVVSHTGTWSSYGLNITGLGKYYTLEDSTGLENSTYNAPKYFYTRDGVTFTDLVGINLVINQLNKVVGVILPNGTINDFYTYFFTKIGLTNDDGFAQGGLYDSENNFIGYALNDISGCYYSKLNGNNQVSVPSYFPNNIYNVLVDYNDDLPPYIKFYPLSGSNVLSNLNISLNEYQNNTFNSDLSTYGILYSCGWDTYWRQFKFTNNTSNLFYSYNSDIKYHVASNSTGYSQNTYAQFCKKFNLTGNSNELSFGQLSKEFGLAYRFYDSQLNVISSVNTKLVGSDSVTDSTTTIYTGPAYGHTTVINTIGNPGNQSNIIQSMISSEPVYIYKDVNTISALNNKTYVPEILTTNKYTTYNTTNDNSNFTTTNNIDNSVTNNDTIYNELTENFSEYIDNSVIDNSSVTNNVTNITNNYYGSSSGDSGDSGGGSDNDGVLDTLLQGLLAFFNAIGRVLATVITGLLDMFTTVLDAIANLTTDLTGITDFFGSLFSWMPDPIPQVIGIGVSVCILCAVIRFIRG